jgi:hemerythrin
MPLIWSKYLEVGIPEIDQQHKQLVDQMNALYNAIMQNQAQSEITKILGFLNRYIAQHFGYEESCMHRHKCPVADINKQAHGVFISTLKSIEAEVQTKGVSPNLAIRVNKELLDWFGNHISKIDTQLKMSMK